MLSPRSGTPQRPDITALRLSHCRAEQSAQRGQFHLAALHYRGCLEMAERRNDCRAVQFFALRLAECYDQMNLSCKAGAFRDLAGCAPGRPGPALGEEGSSDHDHPAAPLA